MKNSTQKLKVYSLAFGVAFLLIILGIGLEKYLFSQAKNSVTTTDNLNKNQSQKSEKKERKEIYHCPMHPHIISDHPGTCPICHMDLQKVIQEEDDSHSDKQNSHMIEGRAAFSLSHERQQLIGVTSIEVQFKELSSEIRSSGRVAFDPELFSGIEEYRQALISRRDMKNSSYTNLRGQSEDLVQSAKTKLKLMGLSDEQIKDLSKSSQKSIDLLLPSGAVWVYAEVFEYEVAGIKIGSKIEAEAPSIPGKIFSGKITSISPVVNSPTRTVRLRAIVPDPDKLLRPDTFLNVTVKMDLGKKLVVPEDSILHSGDKTYVFVLKGKGTFEPRLVKTGIMAQDHFEIISGLKEGERVVTAANFLIDSESRLRGVLQNSHSAHDSSSPPDTHKHTP